MQILNTYKYARGMMIEFDYLENSLVFYRTSCPLQIDPIPAIPHEPNYRIKKPRSSYADNPHI